jgi:RimJ/RimL family protein N-acetyltransferase
VSDRPLLQLHPWYSTRAQQRDRLDLAVVDRATDDVVGEVVLNDWDPGNRTCSFRTLIGPAGRGKDWGPRRPG